MMKTLKFSSYVVLLMIGLSTILSSCKKDKVYPIEGNWVGTYNNGATDYYMAFSIKKGGTLDVMDNPANKSQITASGTWTVSSGQFDTILDYGSGYPHFIYKSIQRKECNTYRYLGRYT